jgi:hypothetical protein
MNALWLLAPALIVLCIAGCRPDKPTHAGPGASVTVTAPRVTAPAPQPTAPAVPKPAPPPAPKFVPAAPPALELLTPPAASPFTPWWLFGLPLIEHRGPSECRTDEKGCRE